MSLYFPLIHPLLDHIEYTLRIKRNRAHEFEVKAGKFTDLKISRTLIQTTNYKLRLSSFGNRSKLECA